MVVDDEAAILDGMVQLLSSWGHRPIPFLTFEEAHSALLKEPPDALIVDIRLGEYNGLHLVHLAVQLKPAIIAVVISGFDDPVLRAEASRAGATYLMKPVRVDALKDLLLT